MQLPEVKGKVERRLLVNYRVDPETIARVLPPPFRPQLVGGAAVAGIGVVLRCVGSLSDRLADRDAANGTPGTATIFPATFAAAKDRPR